MEDEKRLADKMESNKKEKVVLTKAKHEERMSQERELLDQQMKFQKAVEASQQEKNAKKMVSAKMLKTRIGCRSSTNSKLRSTKQICRLLQNSPI